MSGPETQSPIALFLEWLEVARETGSQRLPGAMCLSTVGPSAMPEARFVDLKEVTDRGFVFCTSYTSPKARSIRANPNVALTFWWDAAERQVRVTGVAERISNVEADAFYADRSRDARLAAHAARQSESLEDAAALDRRIIELRDRYAGKPIPRPPSWGGYRVRPHAVEFLRFRENRLHERRLFTRDGEVWTGRLLEP